jgi:hypothetical protein
MTPRQKDADNDTISTGAAGNVYRDRLDPIQDSSIRGVDLTEIPRRKSDVQYEPSERSEITDLGRRGRQIATQDGSLKHTPPLHLGEDIKKPLTDRLLESLVKIPGHDEKKGFFPEEELARLLNRETIRQELESCFDGIVDSDTIDGYALKICGVRPSFEDRELTQPLVYKKIFAILVLSEKTKAIQLFLKEQVSDLDLPLSKVYIPGKSSNLFNLARKGARGIVLSCFSSWGALAIRRFEEWQWTTLAPFFHRPSRKNVGHFPLSDHIPLPFTADSRYDDEDDADKVFDRLEYEGGYSKVFKVAIHPEHHDFHNTQVCLPSIGKV